MTMIHVLASIPPPPFRNLELGPVVLHGYGFTMGLAIVVAMLIAERALRGMCVDVERFQSLALPSVVAGFVGARLYHVASEPSRFADHPGDIVKIWEGGLGIYGAVAGGAIAAMVLAPRAGIPRAALADVMAPAMLAAQAIGRVGNYLNQELFGRPTELPWALEVDPEHRPDGFESTATFHPTFAYEALANLVLLACFIVLMRRWTTRAPGVLFSLYVAAYSAVRIPVERLRIDDANVWLGLRQNEWVAGVVLVAALAAAAVVQRRWSRTTSPADGALTERGGTGADRPRRPPG